MISRSQPTYAPPSRSTRTATGGQAALGWVLLAVPLLVFGWVWQQYAINIPKWDDHALRAFLFNTDQETTLSGKLYQLFRQHNEHRIVYDRLITLLDYWLTGKLNYVHLMAIGNLSLVGLLAVFYAVLGRSAGAASRNTGLYAVPVALVLFNLSQWENMYWGMAALQNFSVVLWVLAAFYWLAYTDRWGLAVGAAVLATLTSGNGLLVWPIGFALLLLRSAEVRAGASRTSYRPLLGWTLCALLVIGLYFVGFEKPGGAHAIRPGVTDLLKGWFAVIGAAGEALPMGRPLTNSTALGGLTVVLTLGIVGMGLVMNQRSLSRVWQQVRHPNRAGGLATMPAIALFFWGSAAFLLGTAAVVAYARTGFGADLLITSRYKIYSLTLLALLYSYAVATLPGRLGQWAGLVGGVGGLALAWLSYFSFLDETIWWRHWLTTNQFNWHYTTRRPVAQLDAVTARYTDPAPAFYDTALPVLFSAGRPGNLKMTVQPNPAGFTIQETELPPQGLRDAGAYVLARSGQRRYLFPVWQNKRSAGGARLLPDRQFTTGFRADVLMAELAAGTYQLSVLVVPDGPATPYLINTGQTVTSAGQPADTTEKNW
ncbi:hypothetical protein [Spirosoma sp. 209]|uniref:hypothetical protein n=1 Tax=Spirosoma sp. 209 TaxID=1955701 RepID=UPI001F15D69E|nr:hypothetical protein [Spirosoma sp. 209]